MYITLLLVLNMETSLCNVKTNIFAKFFDNYFTPTLHITIGFQKYLSHMHSRLGTSIRGLWNI